MSDNESVDLEELNIELEKETEQEQSIELTNYEIDKPSKRERKTSRKKFNNPRIEIIEYPEEERIKKPIDTRGCGGNWFEMFFECCCCPCLSLIYCCKAIFNYIQRGILYFIGASKECIKKINEKNTNNEDITSLQIFETCYYVTFELYKVTISSFLIIFTQQKCIDNIGQETTCTMREKFYPNNVIETVALASNFTMFGIFIVEYIFEIMREVYLIKYLSFDQNIPNNDKKIIADSVNANEKIFKSLNLLYILYIKISFAVLFVYLFNICISAVVIYNNYLNKSSIIGFVTNALFVIIKIVSIISITSDGNAYYSAYKKRNIHYNIIKPKYLTN